MLDLNQSTSILSCVALASSLALAAKLTPWLGFTGKKYPPGPKGLPFVGVRLSSTPWKDFEKWGEEHGDVMYLQSSGKGILVLNSHTAASDLLNRRSATYSDRQQFIVNAYLTRGLSFGLANYGDMWRKMGRAAHEVLSKTGVTRYYRVQETEALILTDNLLRDSKNWDKEVSRTTASGLLSAVYDKPPRTSAEDPLILKFDHFHEILINAVTPGIMEHLPWLQYFPAVLTPWKRKAEDGFVELSRFFKELYKTVGKTADVSKENPCFANFLIQERKQLGLSEVEATWLAANIVAGFGSSTEALLWFFLAMVAYPEKQRKCQEELDTVIGRSRMPTMEDKNRLPYIRATVRELLRWRSISPLGNEHLTREDDYYRGYFIPKGTMCLANLWLINRNPEIYGPDVEDFNPDRFIDEKGRLSPALADTKDGHVAYGFGPRMCPARHFANDTLFIVIARLLWAATLSPRFDDGGNAILPDVNATLVDGVKSRPLPFECIVKPRFDDAAEMVAHTRELSG